VASNYVSVPLTDIIASLVSAAAVVLLVRVWHPVEAPDLRAELAVQTSGGAMLAVAGGPRDRRPATGRSSRLGGDEGSTPGEVLGDAPGEQDGRNGRDTRSTAGDSDTAVPRDSAAEIARAYAPYLIIIAIFTIANLGLVKNALAEKPWTVKFPWPGLDVLGSNGKPVSSATFAFGWLGAAGTLMILAGILTAIVLRVRPGRALKAYVDTYVDLRYAIVTVMAVLALAYVMNQSGQTNTLGAFLAQAGSVFLFLSSILGWIGVAVTGSDTSSNALFGALQVQTAARAGLDPLLLAAANSSGGVMGKMISPQNLAIAASAVGMAGREGDIFRKVIGWSLVLLLFMCILVTLQGTSVLGWMVP
jgi:lactate permease